MYLLGSAHRSDRLQGVVFGRVTTVFLDPGRRLYLVVRPPIPYQACPPPLSLLWKSCMTSMA